jgi:AcrR family transcriptional regulator
VNRSDSASAKTGRPRSKELGRVVLSAVLDLVGDRSSLGSLSLIGIAQHTGVSRNAIYRRWKSKEDLYLDVLSSIDHRVPLLGAQSARDNLVSLMNAIAVRVANPRVGRMERAVNAEAGNFPDLYRTYVSEYVEPFLDAMRSAIRRGKVTGEIRVDVSEDVLAHLLISSTMSHLAFGMNANADSTLMSQLFADLAFDGVGPT